MKKIFTTIMLLLAVFSAKSQCGELFISEYIEGSSFNKSIEIYNPTSFNIPLTGNYAIRIYFNGQTTFQTINLTGVINAGSTHVISHSSASPAILALSQQTNAGINFNGDDAVVLYSNFLSDSVDIIGIIGVDPGTEWNLNGTPSTANHTIIRNPTIQQGNLVWTGSCETEWTVMNVDDIANLGTHTMNACGPTPLTGEFTFADHCYGTLASFSGYAIGGDGNYTYAWDFGDGMGTSTVQNPTYMYTASGTYTVTLVVMDGTFATDMVTHGVIVFDKPDATSVPDNTTGCAPLTVCYTTNVTGGTTPYSFMWSTGNTQQDPCEVYSTPGTQDVILIVTDGNGCSDTVTNTITVLPLDDASFTYASGTMCVNDLSVLPTVTGLSGGTFSGTGITNTSTGLFDPAVAGPGCVTITYATNGACPNSAQFLICVDPVADATITPVSPMCESCPGAFNLTAASPGGVWSGIGITNSANGTFDCAVAGQGTFTITYTIGGNCGDMDTVNITVLPQDFLNIYSGDTIICNDIFGYFLYAESGGTWSGTFVTDNANGQGFFSAAGATPGTYYAVYSTSSSCPFEDSIAVDVYDYPIADFNYTTNLGTVDFTDASAGATTWSWDFDDGSPTSSQTNPQHVYALNGTYNVCLTVTNAVGCSYTSCQTITITGLGVNENTTLKMNVYPNPSRGNFTIESNAKILSVSVKDLIGKNVYSKNINGANAMISLEDINNGFYFIEIETSNGKAVRRIEIMK